MTILCYRIEQHYGRWYIIHGSNESLAWAGSHWYFRDETDGPPLTSFASREQAEHYAREILGGKQEEP